MRPLADLPNAPGYTFIGVDRTGLEFPCVVRLDPSGMAGAYTHDGTPCFFKLAGWLPDKGASCIE